MGNGSWNKAGSRLQSVGGSPRGPPPLCVSGVEGQTRNGGALILTTEALRGTSPHLDPNSPRRGQVRELAFTPPMPYQVKLLVSKGILTHREK